MVDEPETEEDVEPDRGDDMLAVFVRVANAGALKVGITLWVGGLIVSGMLVGRKEYFEGLAEMFGAEASDTAEFAKVFRRFAEAEPDRDDDEGFESGPPIWYIHLMNARTYSPGGQPLPANQGVWWRGRIDQIDGFCFGELR